MVTPHEESKGSTNTAPITDSLPPVVARLVEDESREHAATQPGPLLEQYRHGRIEAEAHRISEEVTKEAQERLRLSASEVQRQQSEEDVDQRTGTAEVTDVEALLASSFTRQETLPAPQPLMRLLVPLDGTAEAERSLPYASAFARLLHAHLTLGHITSTFDANRLAQALHLAGSDRLTAQQAFEAQALPYLQDLRWRLSIPPEEVAMHHISAPSVVDGLLELMAADHIDLVTIGLQSRSGADHFRLGRVIDSLIRRSSTPVLLIPPRVSADSSLFTLRHILVSLDGSALAEQALAPLLGLLDQTSNSSAGGPLAVTLLRVAEDRSKLQDCSHYLEELRVVLMELPACSRVQVRAETIVGSAPGAIVGRIERGVQGQEDPCPVGPVDLLIMATHGRGGVGRLLLGSVADYVLPRAEVPVLLVHPVYLDM
jgi:nucleotide-binding universal stress UspA family protein